MGTKLQRRQQNSIFSVALLLGTIACSSAVKASIITYDFADSGGNYGTFSYNDAVSTTTSEPSTFTIGGSWYTAVSFTVDGSAVANPLLGISTYQGNQYAIFASTAGTLAPFLALQSLGTSLFTNASANQLDNRSDANFAANPGTLVFAGGNQNTLLTLTEVAPVPLPATAWLMLSGLGGLGALARKKRTLECFAAIL